MQNFSKRTKDVNVFQFIFTTMDFRLRKLADRLAFSRENPHGTEITGKITARSD